MDDWNLALIGDPLRTGFRNGHDAIVWFLTKKTTRRCNPSYSNNTCCGFSKCSDLVLSLIHI